MSFVLRNYKMPFHWSSGTVQENFGLLINGSQDHWLLSGPLQYYSKGAAPGPVVTLNTALDADFLRLI